MKRYRQRRSLPEEPITLEIDKLSHEGRGLGRHQGKIVFVEQALPGEKVEAKLTFRKSAFDEAKAISILNASQDRVDPPCEYAGICGGCSLQHYAPGAQILFKESVLHELLENELGHSDYEKPAPITGPLLDYRRKARLAVRYVAKKEAVLIGFREKHSSFITNMDSCAVLDHEVSQLLPSLSALIRSLDAFRYIPQIEVACGDSFDGVPRVALVFRHLQPLSADDLGKLKSFAAENSIALYLQPKGMDSIHRLEPETGEDRLYYELPDWGLKMAFHPADFTQVNAEINKQMLQRAIEWLQLSPQDEVLDLFCGLGNFTLPVATLCKQVTGVEAVQEMVDRGYENATRNNLNNVSFTCTDLFKPVEDDWAQASFTKVLLDPPRSGAREILPVIAAKKPERIVYVSCNPSTLARDAAILAQHGYNLLAAGAMDMFPHTTHVESIAVFTPGRTHEIA